MNLLIEKEAGEGFHSQADQDQGETPHERLQRWIFQLRTELLYLWLVPLLIKELHGNLNPDGANDADDKAGNFKAHGLLSLVNS